MLTDSDRNDLRSIGRAASYRKGSILFHEGDGPGPVFVVLGGTAKVHLAAPTGRQVLLAMKRAGDLLGELAALDSSPRSATATVTSELTAAVVPSVRFCEFVESRPTIAMHLLRSMASDLRAAGRDQVVRSESTVTERVAARLLSLAARIGEHAGQSLSVPLCIGHDDLAAWTSASREAVSRAMGELRQAGVVTTMPGHITVVDLEGLRDISVPPVRG